MKGCNRVQQEANLAWVRGHVRESALISKT